MAKGDPITSPWMFYDSGEDYLGRHITGTVTFDGANVLLSGSVTRDPGCVYVKILIGTLDANGLPTGTTKVINMTGLSGTRAFTQAQFNAVGLVNVSDILGFQITASP